MSCHEMSLNIDLFQQLICQASDYIKCHIFKLREQRYTIQGVSKVRSDLKVLNF